MNVEDRHIEMAICRTVEEIHRLVNAPEDAYKVAMGALLKVLHAYNYTIPAEDVKKLAGLTELKINLSSEKREPVNASTHVEAKEVGDIERLVLSAASSFASNPQTIVSGIIDALGTTMASSNVQLTSNQLATLDFITTGRRQTDSERVGKLVIRLIDTLENGTAGLPAGVIDELEKYVIRENTRTTGLLIDTNSNTERYTLDMRGPKVDLTSTVLELADKLRTHNWYVDERAWKQLVCFIPGYRALKKAKKKLGKLKKLIG